MAKNILRNVRFLSDSYFAENLLPELKVQAERDGDALMEYGPMRDVLLLEFRSDEKYFTNELNALLDKLELCCFYEISQDEASLIFKQSRKLEEERRIAKEKEENRRQKGLAYRKAHPELYEYPKSGMGNGGNGYWSPGTGRAHPKGLLNSSRRPGK